MWNEFLHQWKRKENFVLIFLVVLLAGYVGIKHNESYGRAKDNLEMNELLYQEVMLLEDEIDYSFMSDKEAEAIKSSYQLIQDKHEAYLADDLYRYTLLSTQRTASHRIPDEFNPFLRLKLTESSVQVNMKMIQEGRISLETLYGEMDGFTVLVNLLLYFGFLIPFFIIFFKMDFLNQVFENHTYRQELSILSRKRFYINKLGGCILHSITMLLLVYLIIWFVGFLFHFEAFHADMLNREVYRRNLHVVQPDTISNLAFVAMSLCYHVLLLIFLTSLCMFINIFVRNKYVLMVVVLSICVIGYLCSFVFSLYNPFAYADVCSLMRTEPCLYDGRVFDLLVEQQIVSYSYHAYIGLDTALLSCGLGSVILNIITWMKMKKLDFF